MGYIMHGWVSISNAPIAANLRRQITLILNKENFFLNLTTKLILRWGQKLQNGSNPSKPILNLKNPLGVWNS